MIGQEGRESQSDDQTVGFMKGFPKTLGVPAIKKPFLSTCSFLALYGMPKKENEMTQTLSVQNTVLVSK